MKMYIVIKKDVPASFVPVIAAHASLACFRKYENDADMQTWVNGIFMKVVCVANEIDFEKLKEFDKNIVLTESRLDNAQVCIAFCPREEYPKMFKFLPMWKV